MGYIINIFLVINIMFFLLEFLHIFNKIGLVLILVSGLSFYFLFYFLSFAFNTSYANYIYSFYFKYNSIFFLLKQNLKLLFNIKKFSINYNYFLLVLNKYNMYNVYLNNNMLVFILKTKLLVNALSQSFDLKFSNKLLNNLDNVFLNVKNFFFF